MFGFIVGGGKSDFHENWRRQNRLFPKRKRNSRSSLGCSLAEGAGTADRKRKRESKPAFVETIASMCRDNHEARTVYQPC